MKRRARSMLLTCKDCGCQMKHPCVLTKTGRYWYCWSCNKTIKIRVEFVTMNNHCENCKHFDHTYHYCGLNVLRDIPTPNCSDFEETSHKKR